MDYFLFFIGLILLVKGADWLVKGASSLADKVGIPQLAIGLTIVALGTTLPELMVSIFATTRGNDSIIFGNIIGSCITNILLIFGIIALLTRLKVRCSTTWKEIPFAFLAALLLFIFALRPLINSQQSINVLSRVDGIILLLFLAIFLYYVFELAKNNRVFLTEKDIKTRPVASILLLMLAGSAGLYLGGGWSVSGAVTLASLLGLSDFLISATIMAVGTSLPELILAVTATLKNDSDIAIGNIIGSNVLNVFWVLGLTSVVSPLTFPSFIKIDIVLLLAATTFLFVFMFTSRKHELDRWEGMIFLAAYAGYITFLVWRG